MGKLWNPQTTVSWNRATTALSNIVSIDESPLLEGLLYVGTDDGLLNVSEDGGRTWRKTETFPGVPANTYVADVAASPRDVNVVFVAFAARLLGAKGYGQFLLVTTMVVVVSTLANLGIRPFIVRMLSREKERTGQILSNVLAVRTLLAAVAYGGLVAFVHIAGYDSEVGVLTAIQRG